jgi:glucan-binding YG repeat protein
MSTEMPTNVINIPVEQVTEAIVAAAKRVRKPKAEITIVEQIISDILAGKFAEETTAHLKQIFGDDFCIKRGLMEKPKKIRKTKARVVADAQSKETDAQSKEKKARKPKAPKEASVEDKPKVKKVSKTKESPVEAPVKEKPKKAQKKATTPKDTEPKEVPIETPVEAVATPVLDNDEFSENWGNPLEDELVEEELTDIEEEE